MAGAADRSDARTEADARAEPRVGAYVLGPQVGVGGMGVVFRGREPASGRDVAVKLMRELGGGVGEQRFLREAEVLGPTVEDATIDRLVAHAAGNPFFLEELTRAAAQGTIGQLPDSVLGIVQSHLQALDDESRRLLRAASVFGGGFSAAALASILGPSTVDLLALLATLVARELLTASPHTDAPSYRFRHDLVRDASYATLTPDDLRLAHRLAADWLVQDGAREPMEVAGHYLRAAIPGEAQRWFHRSAEQALEGGDFAAAVERAFQAIDCGATGETLAELRLVQAEARHWSGSLPDAERWAIEACAGLRPGSPRWFTAQQTAIYW